MKYGEFEAAEMAARITASRAESRQFAAAEEVVAARAALAAYPAGAHQRAAVISAEAEFQAAKAAAAAARESVAMAAKAAAKAWRLATA